ncbi:hypothetical protein B0H14DRAFT_3861535 [Mycena olivaceomarginata]|nr:hypothetical protein B0H14DRAFT_3861535 [Mycena olivaceomarginata]
MAGRRRIRGAQTRLPQVPRIDLRTLLPWRSHLLARLVYVPQREHPEWVWVWVVCLFGSNVYLFVARGYVFTVTRQLWSLTTASLQARLRAQLNTVLFAKTLVRKDIASSAAVGKAENTGAPLSDASAPDADGFSSKAQVMAPMTTDVDRVARFTHQLFVIIDAPNEIAVGKIFLYNLLGVLCFFGLGVAIPCLLLNHFAGKTISGAQDNLMKARDERVALMNEKAQLIEMHRLGVFTKEALIVRLETIEILTRSREIYLSRARDIFVGL